MRFREVLEMGKTIVYAGGNSFKYYLIEILTNNGHEVSEEEFFSVVGMDRDIVPMKYNKDNINRQDFFLDDVLIGYRVR